MHTNLLRAAVIVGLCVAWAPKARAQEYHAALKVVPTPKGAIMFKQTSYESGSELHYSFECERGKPKLLFHVFNPADWGDANNSEGDNYESHMPFSVKGLHPFRHCGPYCRMLVQHMDDSGDRPTGGLYGPMTWATFSAHADEIISEEGGAQWEGYAQFRLKARQRIAEFHRLCGL